MFVHEDPEFDDLVRIVAGQRRLSLGLIEKDYWVTHTLWALHQLGLEIWFKGGTSLSKGFGLIERFSEDLDLKIDPGSVEELPAVSSWKSENKGAIAGRKAHFEKLETILVVPGAQVALAPEPSDPKWRSANLQVTYPGRHLEELGVLRPFVLLEVGNARVTPAVERTLSSFVHDHLASIDSLGAYDDNRPHAVRCVHPIVTLLEKLDAISRRFPREELDPAGFVRHYEDAARITCSALPAIDGYESVRALALEMLTQKQIAAVPSASDTAFNPDDGPRWESVRRAHVDIEPMYWGERIELARACERLREWIEKTLGDAA